MSEEQTFTYDASSETKTDENGLTPEEGEALLVGDAMETEQEQLLAGKYKNAEELEKAHVELQKKLGEKSDRDSQKESSKNELTEEESIEYDNILDKLWDEGSNNKLSQETFKQLQNMSPVEVAKLAMQARQQSNPGQREFTEQDVQQIHGLVGGQENYENMMGWAAQNVSEQEVNLFDAVMDQGNPLAAYFAVQSMALKYQDAAGRDGQMVTGKAPKSSAPGFQSQQEMIKAMEDPRYNDDPAYREEIMAKLERSNINF